MCTFVINSSTGLDYKGDHIAFYIMGLLFYFAFNDMAF